MFDRPAAIAGRLKTPLLLAAAMLGCWFALQCVVFRSGAYLHVAQPQSNAGAVMQALLTLGQVHRAQRRTVLVFGDSRIGEGFSARLAAGDGDIDFINVAVPGSTSRTWHYLLREIDRRGYRYDAIAIGTLFTPTDRGERRDWALDPSHQVALVGLRDAFEYPLSFGPGPMRRRALHAVLFPALALRNDLRDFFAAPLERWRLTHKVRPKVIEATLAYAGRDERLPALAFSPDGKPLDLSAASEGLRALIDREAPGAGTPIPPELAAANAAYEERWVGAMAERAARRGARTFVFPIPRTPYPPLLAVQPATPPMVASASRMPSTEALPAGMNTALESPEYFFDLLHLNRAGRERMSRDVGERIRARLDEGRR
jgi:hypothetical protein